MTMLTRRTRSPFVNDFWMMFSQPYDLQDTKVRPKIVEAKDSYKICLTAPGLESTDFNVTIEGHKLTVGYDSSSKKERFTEEAKYSRTYTLPNNCDLDKIESFYRSGILNVTIPKTESSKVRTIEVK